MNARTIQILGGATIVLALLAVWAKRDHGGQSSDERTGGKLYPGLDAKVNLVTAVEIENKDEQYTLEKKGDAWTIAEKGGYPIQFDKIREIINAIASFEIVEPKTSKPELYERLAVQDPKSGSSDPEAANATRVALRDATGQVLADVIVGKPNASGESMASSSLFVRKNGEAQSYEVFGRATVGGTSTNWLDKEILKIPRERVRRVVTTHPDGERLEITKDERKDENFVAAEMPEGRELKYPAVTDQIGSALGYMMFEDVKPVSEVPFDDTGGTGGICEYETWDGLRVTVKLAQQNEKYYAQFACTYDPTLRVEPSTVTPPPAPPEGEGEPPPPAEEPLAAEEQVRAEAEKLSQKLAPWAFEIPGYRAKNFEMRIEELLKPLEAPAPAPVPPDEPPPPTDGGNGDGQGGG